MSNNKKILFSSIFIILSFFMGYFYKTFEINSQLEKFKNKKFYIDIKQTKTGLKIKNPNSQVLIFVNGQKLSGDVKININD